MSVLRRRLAPGIGAGVPVRERALRVPLGVIVAAWLLRRAARGAWWLVRHPTATATVAALAGLWWVLGRVSAEVALLAVGAPIFGAFFWAMLRPVSFDRWVEWPARSWWRRTWTYRREWQPAMVTAGLAIAHAHGEHLPRLGRVRSGPGGDRVRVRMLPGQTLEDWSRVGPRLAQTFAVEAVRVRSVRARPHDVELWCARGEPLAAAVPVSAAPAAGAWVDLGAVPVGVRDDGGPLALPVLYSHLLVAGETGSGKGSVIWSLVAGLGPAVRDGLVRLWVIDPKGGLELGAGEPLFDRFCPGGPEDAVVLLEAAVAGMRARARRLRGVTRKLVPTTEDPLIVVVIDEVASLTAYVPDAALRRRLASALSLLLSQGRAVGVAVVAATQDARKETLGMRDLFPARVALRTAEAAMGDLILGDGSRDRGARTEAISEATPGVGFVVLDGEPEPVRVRFSHVTDGEVGRLVAAYRPQAGGKTPRPRSGVAGTGGD